MQKEFLFVQSEDMLKPEAPVYFVTVGESMTDALALRMLSSFAAKQGYFFAPRSRSNEQRVQSMVINRLPEEGRVCYAQMVVKVNVTKLVLAIANREEDGLQNPPEYKEALRRLRDEVTPIDFVRECNDRTNPSVLTYVRKNLSLSDRAFPCCECCPFECRCTDYHVARVAVSFAANDITPENTIIHF